jgi:hypothetical protein
MPISSTRFYYENFISGRIYLVEKPDSIVIKVYQTWKGKQTAFKHGLSISFKRKKPLVYFFTPTMGVRNYTYKNLNTTISEVFDVVAWRKKDSAKKNTLIKKTIKFFHSKSCKVKTIEAFNIEVLKQWFPLIANFSDRKLLDIIPLLNDNYLRRGFRKEKLKDAVKIWFGRTPKGLIKRVGQLLQQSNIAKLNLAITCRDWNLDLLYRLLDLEIVWNCSWRRDLVKLLFDAYTQKRVLLLLEDYCNSCSARYERILEDTFFMFAKLGDRVEKFYYPKAPRSFLEVHDTLFPQYYEDEASEALQNMELPKAFPQLHNHRVGDLQLVLPKKRRDLYYWGIKLNNCLASYVSRVAYKDYTVIGVIKNNAIAYALGLQKDRLIQFSGFNNCKPSIEVKKVIYKVLVEAGIKV